MGVDEDLIAEAQRVSAQLRRAALLLDQFTGRLDVLTAQLVDGTRKEMGDESAADDASSG